MYKIKILRGHEKDSLNSSHAVGPHAVNLVDKPNTRVFLNLLKWWVCRIDCGTDKSILTNSPE